METELSIELKMFFVKLINVYGEDVAYAMAMSKPEIIDSLNCYSNFKFDKYDSLDIYKELLKTVTLCNNTDNIYADTTRNSIRKFKVSELYRQIDSDPKFRSALVKTFINKSHYSYEYILTKCEDDDAKRCFNMIDNYTPRIEKKRRKVIAYSLKKEMM